MSTIFEKKIIMPKGSMGITTLMDLSREDRKSVERWHKNEWDEFREEVVAYKHRVLGAARDAYLWNREKCILCKKMRELKSKYRQRGSIILGSATTASAGPGNSNDCTYTASTISNLLDFCIPTCVAYTKARLFSDGDWYWSEGTVSWLTSRGTWIGSCAVAEYDTRWTKVSGDAPNLDVGGTDGVWSAGTSPKQVGYQENLGALGGSFTLECRDGISLNTLFTDSFNMDVDVTP